MAAQQRVRTPIRMHRNQRGFTMIEILFVIGLVVGLMTFLVRNFTGQADRAKEDQTRIGMQNVGQALELYRVHNNRYPTTQQGLEALRRNPDGSKRWRGPYLESDRLLMDAWEQPLRYESDGRGYQIISSGVDLTPGTDKDIYHPPQEGE